MKITKSHLKELVKQSIIGFLSEEDENEKQTPPEKGDDKPITNIEDNPFEKEDMEEGGPGSGRPTKPGSNRDVEKRMDKAVSDANAKLDAAEKAMKKKKNEEKLSEAVSFDVKKMLSLVKKDKFLKYVAKKDFKGKVDPRTLEQMYFMYIKGDRGYEKLYKKIK